jgi:hypothetical protein
MGNTASEHTSRSDDLSRSTMRGRGPKRSRIPYHEDPDYTKPLLEIPEEARQQILARLRFLYGEEKAGEAMPELKRILRVHHAHKSQELVEAENGCDPKERFTEKDMVLITYGDMVEGEEDSPGALPSFCRGCRVSTPTAPLEA